jgi:hypothetical protein
MLERKRRGLRSLSPYEYIEKQVSLDQKRPEVSALAPTIHARFLRSLQGVSFVKAFGFQDLLKSKDVFSLMGFWGEEAISFSSLPRENEGLVAPGDKERIVRMIAEALKRNGYYDLIMSSKLYE